ncbi:hypothetical protein N801_14800 [Knoellia aerolata DSM 18566]|uniref:Uncharacterized protein n=2 Tax=Knoellia TaxID=136099 RepID=A0A0A0JUG9_9MICO|nr:hypothetical protein N801_14800 [Knoellia aerolata DSM 18566]
MRELGDAASFEKVGKLSGGLDKRSVATALTQLDATYRAMTTDGKLLVLVGRHYELTPAGEAVADELIEARVHFADLLRGTSTKHREAWVPVTNECIKYLPALKKQVARMDADIQLHASPYRSTDLQPGSEPVQAGKPRGPRHHALYSACIDIGQLTPGEVSKVDVYAGGPTSVVVIEEPQPFKVLAHRNLFPHTASVSIQDLWDLDGGLIVPEGGAVRDLLDGLEGGWERRRPYQGSTDLETGLQCLTTESLVDSPALIVHGQGRFDHLTNDGYRLYELSGTGGRRAVTGMYQRDDLAEALLDGKRKIWSTIWQAASDLWLEPKEGVAR